MTTSSKGYEFKVNGEQFTSEKPDLTALEILTVAKQGGAIPNDPEGYILEGEKARYQGNDKGEPRKGQCVLHGANWGYSLRIAGGRWSMADDINRVREELEATGISYLGSRFPAGQGG